MNTTVRRTEGHPNDILERDEMARRSLFAVPLSRLRVRLGSLVANGCFCTERCHQNALIKYATAGSSPIIIEWYTRNLDRMFVVGARTPRALRKSVEPGHLRTERSNAVSNTKYLQRYVYLDCREAYRVRYLLPGNLGHCLGAGVAS